eukprot:3579993-Amphidinium_carterae.1
MAIGFSDICGSITSIISDNTCKSGALAASDPKRCQVLRVQSKAPEVATCLPCEGAISRASAQHSSATSGFAPPTRQISTTITMPPAPRSRSKTGGRPAPTSRAARKAFAAACHRLAVS